MGRALYKGEKVRKKWDYGLGMSEIDRKKKIERESFVPTFVLSTRIRLPRLILHNKLMTNPPKKKKKETSG